MKLGTGVVLAVAVLLGGTGCASHRDEGGPASSPTPPPTVQLSIDSAPTTTEVADRRFCSRVASILRQVGGSDPPELIDRLDAVDRADVDPERAATFDAAIASARRSFEASMLPEGGWYWSNETLVTAVNAICSTTVEPTWSMATA